MSYRGETRRRSSSAAGGATGCLLAFATAAAFTNRFLSRTHMGQSCGPTSQSAHLRLGSYAIGVGVYMGVREQVSCHLSVQP